MAREPTFQKRQKLRGHRHSPGLEPLLKGEDLSGESIVLEPMGDESGITRASHETLFSGKARPRRGHEIRQTPGEYGPLLACPHRFVQPLGQQEELAVLHVDLRDSDCVFLFPLEHVHIYRSGLPED